MRLLHFVRNDEGPKRSGNESPAAAEGRPLLRKSMSPLVGLGVVGFLRDPLADAEGLPYAAAIAAFQNESPADLVRCC